MKGFLIILKFPVNVYFFTYVLISKHKFLQSIWQAGGTKGRKKFSLTNRKMVLTKWYDRVQGINAAKQNIK